MRIHYFIGLICLIFFQSQLYAQTSKISNFSHFIYQTFFPYLHGKQQLIKELELIIGSNAKAVDIAVFVKSMKNGELLYTKNINKPLAPASTLKILTAEAALIYLGPEYRFSTQVRTDAKKIENGVLQGNLYILLNGDPTLTYTDLVIMMDALKQEGIKTIQGDVIIDNTAYDENFYGPGWNLKDKVFCYSAPISASIINHNCVTFQISPAKVAGKSALVTTFPKYFYPQIKNTVKTREKQNCSVHLDNAAAANMIAIDGCMNKSQPSWGITYVLSNIAEYNRALFKNILNRLAIKVAGKITFGRSPDSTLLINQHTSFPLSSMITEMLKKSDNVIASALFKKIGQLYTNQPGSWSNGSLAVTEILTKHAGIIPNGLRILDGSGLSPDNLVTPAQMMQVLNFAYHHYGSSYEFITALPIAGVDGTLKNRLANLTGQVRAKTGTISGVVSLAGYAITAEKEPLAFVIMINGNRKNSAWEYRLLEDKIVTALTRYKRYGS